MLSSSANAIFRMSRYLERSGNIARCLDVNWHMTLDVSDEYETYGSHLSQLPVTGKISVPYIQMQAGKYDIFPNSR